MCSKGLNMDVNLGFRWPHMDVRKVSSCETNPWTTPDTYICLFNFYFYFFILFCFFVPGHGKHT